MTAQEVPSSRLKMMPERNTENPQMPSDIFSALA
jgi:hypothetical protein